MYVDVLSPDQIICELPVTLANGVDHIPLVAGDSLRIYLPSDTDVEKDVTLKWHSDSEELQAPIKKGEAVGSVFALYKGELIGQADLCTTADISRSDMLYGFYKISEFTKSRFFIATLISAVVLAVAYIFGSAYLRQKRKRSKFK